MRVGLWRKLSAEELMLLNCGVGEDSWESLACKEIQPVHPKGDQSWVFFGRNDAKAETPVLWPLHAKELTRWKGLWCWEGLGEGGEGDDRGWDGWMASLTRWTWVWVNSGSWWWSYDSWGRKELDMTERLNWTLLILKWVAISSSWGSSHPRDQTRASCLAGRLLTVWGTREVRSKQI